MEYIYLRIPGLFPVCLKYPVFTEKKTSNSSSRQGGGRSDVGGQDVLTGATDLPGRDLVRV